MLCLDVTTSTSRDTSCWYEIVWIATTIKVRNLIIVIGEVVIHCPVEVLSVHCQPVETCFNTHIIHRTNVAHHLITEVRTCWYGCIVEQVAGLTIVPINATSEALLENTPVKSYVVRGSCLPLQVWIVCLWTSQRTITSDWIVRFITFIHFVYSKVIIVADTLLLTSHTPAETKFQV